MNKNPITYVSPQDAHELLANGAALLDVRLVMETADKWIETPDRIAIPLEDLSARISELSPDRTWIICCIIGVRSQTAAEILQNNGFQNVLILQDGLLGWQTACLPFKTREVRCCQCQNARTMNNEE